MMDKKPFYPLSVVAVNFEALTRTVDVIVIASSQHFGVLIPLSDLPPVLPKWRQLDIHALMAKAIADLFYVLAMDYVEGLKEEGGQLALPDPDEVGARFLPQTYELEGQISGGDKDPLIFKGEYLFIAEVGITINEFFLNTELFSSKLH